MMSKAYSSGTNVENRKTRREGMNMTKKALRGFALGLFVATSIVTLFHFNIKEDVHKVPHELSTEDMKSVLEGAGFVILSEEQYEQLVASDIEEDVPDEGPPTPALPSEEQVYYAFISIQHGMTSSQVATQLERARIIENRQEFIDYMDSQRLNRSIKTGEYQLHSGMSIAEIAAIIT